MRIESRPPTEKNRFTSVKKFSPEEAANIYPGVLSRVFELFNQNGIDARIAGTFGKSASLNMDPPSLVKPSGELRDLDIIIVGPTDPQNVAKVMNQAQIVASPIEVDGFASTLNMLNRSLNEDWIQVKDHHIPIPDKRVLEKKMVNLLGVEIPSFHPQTQFHIPALVGHFRIKDYKKSREFLRQITDSKVPLLDEKLFEPFHELYRVRKNPNPAIRALVSYVCWNLDALSTPSTQHIVNNILVAYPKIQQWVQKQL
jgi:hypothetical protein